VTFPTRKLDPINWIAADDTARDVIGSDEGLRVGDFCMLESDGSRYQCASVDGADASSWAAAGGGGVFADEYEVDFTGLGTQDLTSGGDGSKTIDGKTWTLANSANATSMDVTNGTGIVFVHGNPSTNIDGSTESSPLIYADHSQFASSILPTDEWRLHIWYEIANLDATFEFGAMGYRAPSSWNATKNSALVLQGYGNLGSDAFTLKLTGASQSDSTSGRTPAARPSTDRVAIIDLLQSGGRVVHYSGVTYSGGWPAPSAWKRIASGHWMVQSEVTDDLGPDFQILLAIIDTTTGDTDATVTFKRMLLQRRAT
jgi:hypothetical protein